jgi:hypothetical protein
VNERRGGEAYAHYLAARARIEPMLTAERPAAAGSEAERDLRDVLQSIWTAAPEDVADLRRCSKAISGSRRSHYAGERAAATRERLERDLQRLLEAGDPALWLGEPAVLGAFGVRCRGRLVNEDSLRFYRVLSLLQEAGVLRDFRGDAAPTVWEIGGGWGGFAYQFKTLYPEATYLITGMPEVLLVAATYVQTLFPAAHVRYFDDRRPDAFWEDWDQVDFAFAPDSIVGDMRAPAIGLTLDLDSLARQHPDTIDRHVRQAHRLHSRYFFSGSAARKELAGAAPAIRAAVERWYWPHPLCAPAFLDRRFVERSRTYLLGWRRLRP